MRAVGQVAVGFGREGRGTVPLFVPAADPLFPPFPVLACPSALYLRTWYMYECNFSLARFSRAKMSHDRLITLLLEAISPLTNHQIKQNKQTNSNQTTQDPIMKLSQVAKNIAQGTKDLAVASAGVSPYGVIVDGAVKSPISNAVEVVDEVAEASRGVNSYGTNVDHRLGHELEKH